MAFFTIARPSPRPERSVIIWLVEKPDSNRRPYSSPGSLFLSLRLRKHAPGDSGAPYAFRIDALPVVRNDDFYVAGIEMGNADRNMSPPRLSMRFALTRRLDSMIDRIAKNMHEGIFELLENAFFELYGLAGNIEADLFSQAFCNIVCCEREGIEQD